MTDDCKCTCVETMDELQQARAKWLDAEARIIALQRENQRLSSENFELQMKLIGAQTELSVTKGAQAGLLAALLFG
jgi:hypothetical protein